jgi:outer membrane translocation and assembly module TamA
MTTINHFEEKEMDAKEIYAAKPWLKYYPEGVSDKVDTTPISVPDLLDRMVEKYSNKTALIFYGNKIISTGELMSEMKTKQGDIFSREVMRQDVGRIMDRYDNIARPFASVTPLFNIDQEKKTVALNIDVQEGGEVRIGRIDITGNVKTRDKVIRREFALEEGRVFSSSSWTIRFYVSISWASLKKSKKKIMK